MTRIAIGLGLLLAAHTAFAADADAAFQQAVQKSAAEDKQYIESWWTANLDSDAALERAAVLCPLDKEDHKGYFIIEKDAAHRWEISFDFDSRTRACKGKPAAPPAFEKRKSGTVDWYQGHLEGYEITSYALRIGQPVIVREELVEKKGGRPSVKDWDALTRKKGVKYQTPESLRQLNN